jgi:hypothetical protein
MNYQLVIGIRNERTANGLQSQRPPRRNCLWLFHAACAVRAAANGDRSRFVTTREKRSPLVSAKLMLLFAMRFDRVIQRRVIGTVLVLLAITMVICGQTLLRGRLSPPGFLMYWLICLVFTCLAIVIAFRDAREMQQKVKREHRALLDETLKTIEGEARAKKRAVRNHGKRR